MDYMTNLCASCAEIHNLCSVCSLPVQKDCVPLADHRYFCPRDSRITFLNSVDIERISFAARENLERTFLRFMTFPSNLAVETADGIRFISVNHPGQENECNMGFGSYSIQTNGSALAPHIIILTGLTAPEIGRVTAHECAHAWIRLNTSSRTRPLSRETQEGFCELLTYLLMDELHQEREKKHILERRAPFAQLQLFLKAKESYGLNEVIEWMKYGLDTWLFESAPERIRDVQLPQQPRTPVASPLLATYVTPKRANPDRLLLKGLMGTSARPLALINDQTLGPGESGKVGLGESNVTVQCLQIFPDSVRIQVAGERSSRTLALRQTE